VRPDRIEVEGFGAFAAPTAVEFGGVDLFALTGPTGSGKTTVLDAVCFALYGSIPRYDDRRLVAPVISQGRAEARVRLDFHVGDEACTAVRVVRRTAKGASTKEARLERNGEVVAGNEKEVTAAVEELLGLTFEHFTTCVVLPQGEFARFLHDRPERRQDLLVNLLDLRVYERMGELARGRAAAARATAQVHASRLESLAAATPEAQAAAARRVTDLAGLLAGIDAALPEIDALTVERDAAQAEADTAAVAAERLEATTVPAGVVDLGDALAAAGAALDTAVAEEAAAQAGVAAAEAAAAALPARAAVERAAADHVERADLVEQRARGAPLLAERVEEEARTVEGVAAAVREHAEAAGRLDAARVAHRAHAVRADIVAGEPCPVCLQVVQTVPDVAAPADLEDSSAELSAAETALEHARKAEADARHERVRVEEKLAGIGARVAEVDERLAGAPELDDVQRLLAELSAADEAVERAKAADAAARKQRAAAQARLDGLNAQEEAARLDFDRARDALAGLSPPPRRGSSVAAHWAALAAWAAAEAPARRALAAAGASRAADLDAARTARVRSLAEACAALEVSVGNGALRDAVVDARTRAEADERAIAKDLAEASELRTEIARLDREQQLTGAMASHLSARGFEKWLLDEALGVLVDGATDLLLELSGGQYSLELDDKRAGFLVVDHRNADERRLARSLSGGETFLASLALALALADQLALLAARGGARLDSMFLDEGFGTLDPGTLDTVAAAIEALGSRGRMVGVVTHVAELAERMPVRFEVTKGAASASIERVDR
jgi:exonuclease SbcC